MVKLAEHGLTIGDVDLGGLDAESDYKLAQDFVRTRYVDSALKGKETLILGRKGSGKSALFTQLPRLAVESGREELLLIDITPDEYAWAALRSYDEQGLTREQAHTNAWKLTLAIEIAAGLITLERTWGGEALEAIQTLRQFIEKNFGDLKRRSLLPAKSIVKGLESFDLSAFGFKLGMKKGGQGQAQAQVTPNVIEVLIDTLVKPLSEQQVLVELDRLDDAWDGSAPSQSLLIGLLKAAKDLNDQFRSFPPKTGLRIVTFLRTDIYDTLRFDDKDKHRPFELQILWDPDGLRHLVSRRLPNGVLVDEVFEGGTMRGGSLPFDYILRRTFLRPREVLQFVDLCLRQAGTAATSVTKEDVRAAEATFSTWKVADLKQEFSKALPEYSQLLEALRQGVHRYDSYDEIIAVLEKNAPSIVKKLGHRGVLVVLFETSTIGIRLGGAGSTRFKFTDPNLALPASGVAYVHQGLFKGLNLKETRKPVEGAPTEEDAAIAEDE